MPAVDYGTAWLQAFLERASGLEFEEAQAASVLALAERKLVDLFDVAEQTASRVAERSLLAELRPLLVFLADAGVPGPLDELVRVEVPRLMAAMLLLAGRIIALLEPANMSTEERLDRLLRHTATQPTRWEVERATRVLDMTL